MMMMMMMAAQNDSIIAIRTHPFQYQDNEKEPLFGCDCVHGSFERSQTKRRKRKRNRCCKPFFNITTHSFASFLFLWMTTVATTTASRWTVSHCDPVVTPWITRNWNKYASINPKDKSSMESSLSSSQLRWTRIRGGELGDEESTTEKDVDDEDENNLDELAKTEKTKPRHPFWSTFASAFEMNDDSKEEACCNDNYSDDDSLFLQSTKSNFSTWMEEWKRKFFSLPREVGGANMVMVPSTQTGRGGALVKVKPPPSKKSMRTSTTTSILQNYVRKISWTQTWVDHLPNDDDEKEYNTFSQASGTWNNDDGDKAPESIDATILSHASSSLDINTANASTTTNSGTMESSEKKRKRKKNLYNKEDNNHVQTDVKYDISPRNKKQNGTDTKMQQNSEILDGSLNVTSSFDNVNFSNIQEHSHNNQSSYVSSGYWNSIDNMLTFGLVGQHPEWRVSSRLRTVRKMAAHVTGLHGLLSGKPYSPPAPSEPIDPERLGLIRRRLSAIDRARRNVERVAAQKAARERSRNRFFFWSSRSSDDEIENFPNAFAGRRSEEEMREMQRRKERVRDIDREMNAAQKRLQDLACEKDVLQRRYNPLWNYTVETTTIAVPKTKNNNDTVVNETIVTASRQFNFPSNEMVDEYLDMLFASGRIEKLNHTDLWRIDNVDDEEDDDDFLSPLQREEDRRRRAEANENSGSWILRNGIGEKIGETAETAAYRAVCHAIMGILARVISNFHGLNVMTYSDIRLYTEQAPELPPLSAGMIPGSNRNRNYAQATLQDAMRKGSRNNKYRRRNDAFIQRDAVVETLTSQCQIAAPLMKLFPLAWQRAILGNIVILITSVVADFCEGIEFQILGHRLSLSFVPITEEDMLRSMGRGNSMFNPRRRNPEQFEAAVRATAEELSENLKFLDRWHERALGGGMLRTQIAMLIARLVLTLTDDVLGGSKIDLWTAHAGGPRLISALEFRTTPNYMDEATAGL